MTSSQQERMLAHYDQAMGEAVQQAYYGHSDFYNYGYWAEGATSQSEASEALVEKLLSFIPEKKGRILDVACGLGASTRQLRKHFAAENIDAINLSEVQLEKGRSNAPGVQFTYMDAVHLTFPDNSFDTVICVEAAHHFKTRDAFFKQAYRVLKPGGRLIMSDIGGGPKWVWQANLLKDAADLRSRQKAAGFEDVQVDDVTDDCWGGFCRNLKRWPSEARARGELETRQFWYIWIFSRLYVPITGIGVKKYFLTSAVKPVTAGGGADLNADGSAKPNDSEVPPEAPK